MKPLQNFTCKSRLLTALDVNIPYLTFWLPSSPTVIANVRVDFRWTKLFTFISAQSLSHDDSVLALVFILFSLYRRGSLAAYSNVLLTDIVVSLCSPGFRQIARFETKLRSMWFTRRIRERGEKKDVNRLFYKSGFTDVNFIFSKCFLIMFS